MPRLVALISLAAIAGLLPAAAQPERSEPVVRVTPMRPPPLRLVCWTGPAISDFCEFGSRATYGEPCSCAVSGSVRQGTAALR